MLIREIKIEVKPSIEEIAKEFCEMDAGQQAELINEISIIMTNWGQFDYDTQLAYIADSLDKNTFINNLHEFIILKDEEELYE